MNSDLVTFVEFVELEPLERLEALKLVSVYTESSTDKYLYGVIDYKLWVVKRKLGPKLSS